MENNLPKQVIPPELRNPTGKGGFKEHPENRGDGHWSKDNSFSYWLNYFKGLSTKELLEWEKKTPDKDRKVAADLAYARIVKSRNTLKEFQEVANRTEGMPTQKLANADGSNIEFPIVYLPKEEE